MSTQRVIMLVDMDCFYAQVEQRLRPELYGTPVAVSQVTGSTGPGLPSICQPCIKCIGVEDLQQHGYDRLLAVSYEARTFGVKRGMSVEEARRTCPSLTVCSVPVMDGIRKADLARYRAASEEIFEVFQGFPDIVVEKASVDEAYLDLSAAVDSQLRINSNKAEVIQELIKNADSIFDTTFLANANDLDSDGKSPPSNDYDRIGELRHWLEHSCCNDIDELRLSIGAKIAEEIRAQVLAKTKFHCSAGIGTNKMMAKLVCARHKPKKQTIIPPQFIADVFKTTPISAIRNLGGKLGAELALTYGIKTMGELASIPSDQLLSRFPDSMSWLMNVVKGEDFEPVKSRIEPKSIAVSKNFPGRSALTEVELIEKWINGLAAELSRRLHEDQLKFQRTARNLVVGFVLTDGNSHSKTFQLMDYRPTTIQSTIRAFMRSRTDFCNSSTKCHSSAISHINMAASKFESGMDSRSKQITEWFRTKSTLIENDDNQNSCDGNSNDDDDIAIVDVVECNSRAQSSAEEEHRSVDIDDVSDDDILIIDDGNESRPKKTFHQSMCQSAQVMNRATSNQKSNNCRKLPSLSNSRSANRGKILASKTKSGKVEKKIAGGDVSKISQFFKP